jgi:hypothetical protein
LRLIDAPLVKIDDPPDHIRIEHGSRDCAEPVNKIRGNGIREFFVSITHKWRDFGEAPQDFIEEFGSHLYRVSPHVVAHGMADERGVDRAKL